MIFIFIFAFITLATNIGLWWWYHQKLGRLTTDYQVKLNNADVYIAELQRRCVRYQIAQDEILRRCEQYRTAAVTEALAAKMRTQPVIKVYPIQRRNMTWIIENHLN